MDLSTVLLFFSFQSEAPSSCGHKPVFTKEEERQLQAYCVKMDQLYHGLTMKHLRSIAFEMADMKSIVHPFDRDMKLAGVDWAQGFLKRNPGLSLRSPEPISLARAAAFTKENCQTFFDLLRDLMNHHHFEAHQIYNVDETGVSTVPNRLPKVLSQRGKRTVSKVVSGERGVTTTLVCSMNAAGNFIPPVIIFRRKRLKAELTDGAPAGSLVLCSDSGYMNSDLFPEYLQHFCRHTRPSSNQPILLILDNHVSHLSLQGVEYCNANHIHLLTLPPHSSHRMQPLDRSFFGPFKKYYSRACDNWMTSHPGRCISQFQVSSLVSNAYGKAATIEIARKGFETTGIYPFNSLVFGDDDFMPSTVTAEFEQRRPSENQSAVQLNQPSLQSDPSEQPDQSFAQPDDSIQPEQHEQPGKEEMTENRDSLKPEDIRPYPRCIEPKTKKRTVKQASVLTDITTAENTPTTSKTIPSAKKRRKETIKSAVESDTWCKICKESYKRSCCEWFKCTSCNEWVCESCFGSNECFLCS